MSKCRSYQRFQAVADRERCAVSEDSESEAGAGGSLRRRLERFAIEPPAPRECLEESKKDSEKVQIYKFCVLPDDPALDSIGPKRIELGGSIVRDPIKAGGLKDLLVAFDDAEA